MAGTFSFECENCGKEWDRHTAKVTDFGCDPDHDICPLCGGEVFMFSDDERLMSSMTDGEEAE